jgi:3-deoxy-D-manno-octulosonate 8-phosphate phosphatase (KDO 8-P phosphatase)
MGNFKEDLLKVKAFAFDVDGVLSGNLLMTNDGHQLRSANIKDGFAIQLAVKKGFIITIITGGHADSIPSRYNSLGVADVFMKSENKVEDFSKFCAKYNLSPENVLYMGDDIPDYNVMKIVGIPTCPSDAAEEIKAVSKYISTLKGGEGCVRDVIEQVMRAQGKWISADAYQW